MLTLVNGAQEPVIIYSAPDQDDELQWWVDLDVLFKGQSKGDQSSFLATDPSRWPEDKRAEVAEQGFVFSTSETSVNGQLMRRLQRFGYVLRDTEGENEVRQRLVQSSADDPEKLARIGEMSFEQWRVTELGKKMIAQFLIASTVPNGEDAALRYTSFFKVKFAGAPTMILEMLKMVFSQGVGATIADDVTGSSPEGQFTQEMNDAIARIYQSFVDVGFFEPADPPVNSKGQRRLAVTPLGAQTVPFCIDHLMHRHG